MISRTDPMICVTDMPDYFGPASFHENDYSFFYKNLQENVAKRVAAYMAK